MIEKNNSFKIGDIVKVISTDTVGQIVDYKDGKWVIKEQVSQSEILTESTQLAKREILFG